MRLTSLSLAASLLLASGTFAHAAGHETMVAPDAMTETTMSSAAAPATGTYIVIGILAALLIVAGTAENDQPLQELPGPER